MTGIHTWLEMPPSLLVVGGMSGISTVSGDAIDPGIDESKSLAVLQLLDHLTQAGLLDPTQVVERLLHNGVTSWASICNMGIPQFGNMIGYLSISVDEARKLGSYWGLRQQHLLVPLERPLPVQDIIRGK